MLTSLISYSKWVRGCLYHLYEYAMLVKWWMVYYCFTSIAPRHLWSRAMLPHVECWSDTWATTRRRVTKKCLMVARSIYQRWSDDFNLWQLRNFPLASGISGECLKLKSSCDGTFVQRCTLCWSLIEWYPIVVSHRLVSGLKHPV